MDTEKTDNNQLDEKKTARKLRNFIRYNSIKSLLPVLLKNHHLLAELYREKKLELTGEFLEDYGVDFSLCRSIHPEPKNRDYIRLDFGTFYLDTKDDFFTFQLNIHETATIEIE